MLGEYESLDRKLADLKLSIDYSTDPEQLVLLTGLLENHSMKHVMNYTYNIKGSHPQTELYLDMNGGVYWRPRYFISQHLTEYNRTNFPQPMEALAKIDVENNELEFKVRYSFVMYSAVNQFIPNKLFNFIQSLNKEVFV